MYLSLNKLYTVEDHLAIVTDPKLRNSLARYNLSLQSGCGNRPTQLQKSQLGGHPALKRNVYAAN